MIATAGVSSPTRTVQSGPTIEPSPVPLPPLAARLVAVIALAKVVFHLATATLWGFHRDEFYYLAGGRHLAWGYVDHPPLTPFLYRVGETLFGDSLFGLHVIPALAGGAIVVMGALLAREFGGGRTSQAITMLVAALGPLFLTTSHFLGTETFELLAWSAATWLVVRIVRTGDVRLWLAVGAVTGLGLLDKHSMAFWIIGAGVGLLATPQRRLLFNGWFVGGAAIALVLFAPNLIWEAQHHWATLEFTRNLRRRMLGESMPLFVPSQFGIVTAAGTVVWVVALRRLFQRRQPTEWAPYRWLAIAYVVLFVLLFASGGKPYYIGPIYLPLVALGAVAIERTWSAGAQRNLIAAIVISGAVSAPLFTPMVPTSALASFPMHKMNSDMGGMLGWHDEARQVAAVYHGLPADQQANAVILAFSYSEASAVDYWHKKLGVPKAISGHNSYWWWGYRNAAPDATIVAVGIQPDRLARLFAGCHEVTTLHAPHELMDDEILGDPIVLCQAYQPWSAVWPQLRMYA